MDEKNSGMNQILIKFKVYSHFSHEVVLGYKCKSGVMFPSSVLLSFFPLLYKTLPEEMPDCFGVGAYKTCADVFLEGSVMSELFRHIRTHLVLSAVLTLLLGIVLTVMPGIAAETLVSVLGWLLVITGIASILSSLADPLKTRGPGRPGTGAAGIGHRTGVAGAAGTDDVDLRDRAGTVAGTARGQGYPKRKRVQGAGL